MKNHLITILSVFVFILLSCSEKTGSIDREKLVSRHNVVISSADSLNSLTLGNGKFAFTADITGLQTFPEFYEHGIPLGTMSEWGWYTAPNPSGFSLEDIYRTYEVNGRKVDYVHQFRPDEDKRKGEASEWLRSNPLRIYLGFIGLQILKADGTEICISEISGNSQTLDLWKGELTSTFVVDGFTVNVLTVCHPEKDLISARIESELINKGRLRVRLKFPETNPAGFGMSLRMDGDQTASVISSDRNHYLLVHDMGTGKYFADLRTGNSGIENGAARTFIISPETPSDSFEVSCHFSQDDQNLENESYDQTRTACEKSWYDFWNSGGAVDFSDCNDPRAPELERRVVLSQYLTRVQCRGAFPPAETGLTYNSWFGKFHLEMHWWHGVHFALWQREEVLAKQMDYYFAIMDNARKTAEHQGYEGVRWPKMTDRDGRESPSTVGTYLIWQQPHPIFYSELLYENGPDKASILKKYRDIVFETARFMASYVYPDPTTGKYRLGPILIPAQESLARETTIDPVFELVYWNWGLRTAIKWKERLGEEVPEKWTDILNKYPELPVMNGVYLCSSDTKDSYTNEKYMRDHPIASGILGVMPETGLVDREILKNTLDTIGKKWNWQSTWGWDFPMLAMSAAAVGRGDQALDFLLMDAPKNRYLPNGHNYQDARLTIYLPGNGGLLTAVAKMCTEDQFPDNGRWKVKWENLNHYVN